MRFRSTRQGLGECRPSISAKSWVAVGKKMTVSEQDHDTQSLISDALAKRLRTLKKKLLKIQKYEQMTDELNSDQKQAIEKKDAIMLAIKELEELNKSLVIIQEESVAAQAQLAENRQKDFEAAIDVAVQEAKQIPVNQTCTLLKWIGLLNERLEYAEFYLEPNLFICLSSMHRMLCSDQGYDIAQALLKKDKTEFLGYTYDHLVKTIESLTLPVKTDKMSFFVTNEISKFY